LVISSSAAAIRSAVLMLTCTRRRGRRETTPAPNQAPSTEAAIMLMSVTGSTVTAAMKMRASVRVGRACPTFSVPESAHRARAGRGLKAAVVGANPPMPSVSKKSVTKPGSTSGARGAPDALLALRRSLLNHCHAYQAAIATSAVSRTRVLLFTSRRDD
jgi:hypothetical protein